MKKQTIFILALLTIFLLFIQSCRPGWTLTYTGDYCGDGIQDRDEEGVDCGGQYCDSCLEYDASTTDSDGDGVMDVSDVCADEDDTVDDDADGIADCIDSIICYDTDGGLDAYTKGSAYILDETGSYSLGPFDDYCKDDESLYDYYCSDGGISTSQQFCGEDQICDEGACQ